MAQVPGPVCTASVGDDWIDAGTMCLARLQSPGPIAWRRDPFASDRFAARRVYSRAAEAAWKRRFDEQLALAGVSITVDNAVYWRSLIGCLAAGSSCDDEGELVFYLVRGGYEGFLPAGYSKIDANRAGWDGRSGTTDVNDVLVVFDAGRALVGAFQLAVPNYYPRTAKMVASDWNGRAVFAYHNGTYDYDGLAVLDRGKLPSYDPKVGKYSYWIDIHHKVGTLGCIEVAHSGMRSGQNFDAFVRHIGKAHGRTVEEAFVRGPDGYSVAALDGDPDSKAFKVRMQRFLGRIYVVDLPTA